MRKELTFYSVLAVCCFVLTGASVSVLAQRSDEAKNKLRDFGSSLKKEERKDKNKDESRANDIPVKRFAFSEDEVIRVETTLVVNDILVLDKNGLPVKGLTKDEFIVREDDQLQEIAVFLPGDSETIPRSIVLLIDYSGSQLPYIKTSIEAAKVLVDKLNPKDRMAIVTDNVEMLQDFTGDKDLLKEKLESLKASALAGMTGRSRQYSALMAVFSEMFEDEDLRPIIIFQTDGDELGLLRGEAGNYLSQNRDEINFSYGDVLTAAEKSRATVYTIIPGLRFVGMAEEEKLKRAQAYLENGEKALAEIRKSNFKPGKRKISERFLKSQSEAYHRQQTAIATIAKITGGWTDFLEQPEQADRVYTEILAGMNQRYVIGYYPINQARDGKMRRVNVEVRGRPEYLVRGRKTYILPKNQ